jgi:hypothetical protein
MRICKKPFDFLKASILLAWKSKGFFEEKAYEERAWTFCKADVPDKNKPGPFVSLLSSPLPAWGQFADEEGWKPRLPSPLE